MAILRLRTLAWESTLNFGRYGDLKIWQVADLNPAYLIWVYYNCSKISFNDSILDALYINEKIEKPGTNPNQENRAIKWFHKRVINDLENGQKLVFRYKYIGYQKAVAKGKKRVMSLNSYQKRTHPGHKSGLGNHTKQGFR